MKPNTYKDERELDARIAEKVMGAEVAWDKSTPYFVEPGKDLVTRENVVPHYSTSIGPAMSVALELRRKGYKVDILLDENGISLTSWDADNNELMKYENIISKFTWYMCSLALITIGEERRDRRQG